MSQTLSVLCQMSTLSYNILTTISQWHGTGLRCSKIVIMIGVSAFLNGFISIRYLTEEISLAVH